MVDRISKLGKQKYQKTGVVEHVIDTLKGRWEDCVGFSIVPLRNSMDQHLFTVFEAENGLFQEARGFNMNVISKACDCGVWQDHGYPCIHAVAYFKTYKNCSFDELLGEVNAEYTYENEKLLFEKNLMTVCIDQIVCDGKTLPPISEKRKAGRPRMKRFRQRTRFSRERSIPNLRCSRCGARGHNVRTCVARESLANKGRAERSSIERIPELDLS